MEAKHRPLTLSRRRWIAVAGGAALASRTAKAAPGRPERILILGAGLAGLCAAYELEQRGYEVVVIEAEPARVGGRALTFRFAPGRYGELGAMRVPQSHHLTRHYIRLFGLSLRPFVELNPDAFYLVGGRRQRVREVRRLDPRFAVQGSGGSVWAEPFDEIVGGTDRLPHAFAERLRTPPLLGAEVVTIEQQGMKAAAVYHSRRGLHRIEGDRLICTLPLPVLLRLNFTPALPSSRRSAMAEVRYGSAEKSLLLAARRFWEQDDGIFGGATYTDRPIGMAYYPSDNAFRRDAAVSTQPGVFTASYALGENARRMDGMEPGHRIVETVRELAAVHPQLLQRGTVVAGRSWSWDNHPFSLGAFAAPGQDAALVEAIRRPFGRLHFAGEHTSAHATWMQGALESALRVVREVTGAS